MAAPIQKISVAGVSAAIWENAGKEGKPYFSVSIEKRYKTENGEWKSSSSFKPADLPKAVLALQKAYEFVMLQGASETASEL